MRAVIFANGELNLPVEVQPGDLIIAADGGARHCLQLGIRPDIVIGDFDSLSGNDLETLTRSGAQIVEHPRRKDATDLELALREAQQHAVSEIIVYAALGARWDQTLANLLLPALNDLAAVPIYLMDGYQEMQFLRAGPSQNAHSQAEVHGQPGDIVSLIPIGGDAAGITTHNLDYPLKGETLFLGSTRGISNLLTHPIGKITLQAGMLLVVLIRNAENGVSR